MNTMKTNTLLLLLCFFCIVSGERDQWCETHNECRQCTLDSYDYQTKKWHKCEWNNTDKKCLAASISSDERMNVVSSQSAYHQCNDLKCLLAYVSFNVYVCSTYVKYLLILEFVILCWCILHYSLIKVLMQMPWKYRNLIAVVDYYLSRVNAMLLSQGEESQRATASVYETGENTKTPMCTDEICTMCNSPSNPYRVGRNCSWCNVLRLASLTLTFITGVTMVSIFSILAASIRPNFDLPFKITLLLLRSLVIVGYYHFAYRELKGTKIAPLVRLIIVLMKKRTFNIQHLNCTGVIELVAYESNSVKYMKQIEPQDGNGDSDYIQPVELDHDIPPSLRNAVQTAIPEVRWSDAEFVTTEHHEFILWYEKPKSLSVMIEKRHLFQCCFSLMLACCALLVISSSDQNIFLVGTSNSVPRSIGYGGIAFFLFCMIHILASCECLQVITTRRMLIFSVGIFGGIYTSERSLYTLCCTAIQRYRDFVPIINVSFQHPQVAGRRLPYLPCNRFLCVRDISGLMSVLYRFAPPMNHTHWSIYLTNLRKEYQCLMFVAVVFMCAFPLTFYYKIFPMSTFILTTIAGFGLFYSALQRAFRVHTMTTQVSRNEKPWVRCRVPVWKVRPPETQVKVDVY